MTNNAANNDITTHTPKISTEALALLGGGKIAYVNTKVNPMDDSKTILETVKKLHH